MKKLRMLLVTSVLIWSCDQSLTDPQIIIDKAIEVAGGEKFDHSRIEFDFRGRHYVADRNNGVFSYERIFQDPSGNNVHDFVTNDGFKRLFNDEPVVVPDTMEVKYTSSVNSVIYFQLLPFRLNDPAVRKQFIREDSIENQTYYQIKVTFQQDGGGEDFEDEFFFWFHKEHFTMDYFAYSFEESDEISFRFRKAVNARVIDGIRFQDYVNYKPKNETVSAEKALEKYLAGELDELSIIESENVQVRLH